MSEPEIHVLEKRLVVETPAQRYNKGVIEDKIISLAKEVPYTLFVNDREILSIATLPSNLAELFVGFMVSEGVILHPKEIIEYHLDEESRIFRMELDVPESRLEKTEKRGMLTSGCAGGVVFSVETALNPIAHGAQKLKLKSESILDRMRELDTYSGIYNLTRGVHAASVADQEKTITTMEDLGRHNAVDKIVGYCFLNGISAKDKLLLTTGRITSEVLTKAARSNFAIVISRSSASALAVKMAEGSRIDVVTYVRGGRFNYFSNGSVELV